MKKLLVIGIWVLGFAAGLYLLWPTPGFPSHPPGSFYSAEPADTESVYRKAYYTNLSRQEIMDYYKKKFGPFSLRLNHPPEFAFSLIRDQTQSLWLEELIHHWKDSIYINGYYPSKPNEQFNYNGVHYNGKITVRYVPSHPITRLTALALTVACFYWLAREYAH